VGALLEGEGIAFDSITRWLIHPGGPQVLRACGASLGLSRSDLACSYEVLRSHGNLSSSTILKVLQTALEQDPSPGDRWLLLAPGPGVTLAVAVLQWD
jgi:alkylresorcinol/alkylpyrone synthase